MKKNVRKQDRVYMNVHNVTMAAVVAILASLNERAYLVTVDDLRKYDSDSGRYALDIELRLTSRYDIYGHHTDWKRMREACAEVYSIVKNDVLQRRYSNVAIGLSFYRSNDDSMVHHYTDYTVDYSLGGSEGNVRFVRLR